MADISVVMPFHGEGPIARQALNSAMRASREARSVGLVAEVVAVLDRADAETSRIVRATEGVRVLEADFGDLGLTRNYGVSRSSAPFISVLDGDDYCCSGWLHKAHAMSRPRTVLRHEWVLSFGAVNEFSQQVSQDDEHFCRDTLLVSNPFVHACAAPRDVFEEFPYRAKERARTGYGYEDWLWLCDTVAAGIGHVTVPGTAFFYRRKTDGMLAQESASKSIMGPSALFAPQPVHAGAPE